MMMGIMLSMTMIMKSYGVRSFISFFLFKKTLSSAFSLCRSKNANNSESEVVSHELEVAAMADVILQG